VHNVPLVSEVVVLKLFLISLVIVYFSSGSMLVYVLIECQRVSIFISQQTNMKNHST